MSTSHPTLVLPQHRDLYYGGAWHRPLGGYLDTFNPATGESLGPAAEANSADVDAAVRAAQQGFAVWRGIKPLERAGLLKKVAQVLRDNAFELALLDAANCGNPICEMQRDALIAAAQIDYYAGLATEVKGETLPMGEGILNYTLREPYGVCARIVAYNHPIMFTAAKMAPPLIAGNAVIMKPPYQAPLSSYRMMELIGGILPPGVLNILSGGIECGQALVNHPDVPRLALIGSVPTGRAIARAGAERLKHVTLELGGKNACIIYPDADMDKAIPAAVNGMNFTWCGQSCGSTSRLFVHESIHDQVVAGVLQAIRHYQPGIPTDMATTMGCIVSQQQHENHGLHCAGTSRGGHFGLWRPAAQRPGLGQRLVCSADRVHQRHAKNAFGQRRDFWPGAVGDQVARRSRVDRASECRGIRPHRIHLDAKFGHRPPHRCTGAGRFCVGEPCGQPFHWCILWWL